MEWFGWEDMGEAVTQAFSTAAELSGIDFVAQEPRMRIIEEEYGRETLRLTHYCRGPHTTAASPPGIRLDITRDEKRVLGGLPKKLDVRGLGLEGLGAGRLTGRREEFRADWERNLVHLLPPGGERGFDEVWDPVSEFVARVMASL